MGKDISNTAKKWAVLLMGIFVLATLGTALIPLVFTQFQSHGAFENATCTNSNFTTPGFPSDNTSVFYCISNSYSPLYGAIPVILVIVFVVFLILSVIAMLKVGKHR